LGTLCDVEGEIEEGLEVGVRIEEVDILLDKID